jgi:uncharacterized protein YhaN
MDAVARTYAEKSMQRKA